MAVKTVNLVSLVVPAYQLDLNHDAVYESLTYVLIP
jgi:hypothetical protein